MGDIVFTSLFKNFGCIVSLDEVRRVYSGEGKFDDKLMFIGDAGEVRATFFAKKVAPKNLQ